jgi:hypothetical protein
MVCLPAGFFDEMQKQPAVGSQETKSGDKSPHSK